ncbi:MAG: DUF4845 domain-containing protein [Gammaproteobacteria bacterium]|nr:MAG: DUF4845 domain-containing protein [Gammaproteobacteria bacterium]
MDKWHHQKGMTAIGWLLVLSLIAFFTLITLRLVPAYLEFSKVSSVLESLKNEPGITRKTRGEILGLIRKRFDVNDVYQVDAKQVVVKKDKGVLKVSINYERREHMVGNIDVVATFDKQVEVVAN